MSKVDKVNRHGRYLNRELSWLRFNERVLAEAENEENPLLERLKFLAIFESNLDEFYMVRVSGLIEQYDGGVAETTPDGFDAGEQLELVAEAALPLRRRAWQVFESQISPALEKHGIGLKGWDDLSERQRAEMTEYFHREIFPLLTPLILHPSTNQPVPFISNRSLNLVIELQDEDGNVRLARVKVPTVVKRAIRLSRRRPEFILLEDLIAANLPSLFPNTKIVGAHRFRVVRDADVEIRQLEAADLITIVEQTLKLRRFGDPVLLEASSDMPKHVRRVLMDLLKLEASDVFDLQGILGLEVMWELSAVEKSDLKFAPHRSFLSDQVADSTTLFDMIQDDDVMVHQPYDSFKSVESFVSSAATDPKVLGIKQTLYRVGTESPIVESLLAAAEAGKQVAALVELKARFDESNNLTWARTLETAGVHVTYGFPELKTHCKLCLVTRREKDGVKQYAHIGTGNYNPATARIYTDLGIFTCDPEIAQDIGELFNYLTGFSKPKTYRKLLVAPDNLRDGIVERVHREIEAHKLKGEGRIIFKLNALVDDEVIEALYAASCAGVQIDLIVRGICCLLPGITGMSENIRVRSIVGRFLEHSRIYYFGNGGRPEAFIGSADMMRRNLDRRVEVLVPVTNKKLVRHLSENILKPYLKDNVKAWEMLPSGAYVRAETKGAKRFNVQEYLIDHPTTRSLYGD